VNWIKIKVTAHALKLHSVIKKGSGLM